MSRQHRHYFNQTAQAWPEPPAADPLLLAGIERFQVDRGENILDLAAGRGRLAAVLRHAVGEEGRIVALDCAEKMLAAGRETLVRQQVAPLCCDAARIACRSGAFDKVICLGSWPHFDQPQRVIHEVWRILRPGGHLLVWHSCCSRRLNAMHASLDGVVAADHLPRAYQLASDLEQHGFAALLHEETPQSYWVVAQKVPDSAGSV